MNLIPEQQSQPMQHQPMQEIYPNVAMSVQDQGDQRLLIIQVPLPRKNIIVPMGKEEAEDIGRKLQAPSIRRAQANGLGGDIILPR